MEIKFKADVAALNAALEVVSIVTPRPITPQGNAGYLFVVRGETCFVYSQDKMRVARAVFPITDVQGEGPFIYPAQYIGVFKFAEGSVAFQSKDDGNGVFSVNIELDNGGGGERSSFDPKLLSTCDRDFEASKDPREFSSGILQEAISLGSPFMAKEKDARVEDQHKSIQIFDASVDKAGGYMYAANTVQMFYFESDAFKDKEKGLTIHSQHLPTFLSFLGKVSGNITVTTGQNMTFASVGPREAPTQVFGWTHNAKHHEKFSYYPLSWDKLVLSVPTGRILNAAACARSQLDSTHDKIRFQFDHKSSTIHLHVPTEGSKSFACPPVDAEIKSENPRDVLTHVNVDHLHDLFKSSKADRMELRIGFIAGKDGAREKVVFRTVDEFWLDANGKVVGGSGVPVGKEPKDAFRCKVTRFMPDKM